MKEFLDKYFDKLLVSFFVLLFTAIGVYFAHKNIDGKAFDWATHAFDIFVGLLSGLITGVMVGKALAKAEQEKAKETALAAATGTRQGSASNPGE